MGRHALPEGAATQSKYPWRAVLRTAVAFVIGVVPMMPVLIAASGIPQTAPGVAGALAISAAVTRLLAVPQVDALLQKWLPILAAEPRE